MENKNKTGRKPQGKRRTVTNTSDIVYCKYKQCNAAFTPSRFSGGRQRSFYCSTLCRVNACTGKHLRISEEEYQLLQEARATLRELKEKLTAFRASTTAHNLQ
jgi:hypothetical protein